MAEARIINLSTLKDHLRARLHLAGSARKAGLELGVSPTEICRVLKYPEMKPGPALVHALGYAIVTTTVYRRLDAT